MRPLFATTALSLACAAGIAVAGVALQSLEFRYHIGRIVGRGELVAIAGGTGIYDNDIKATSEADIDAAGLTSSEVNGDQERDALDRLVASALVKSRSSQQQITRRAVDDEIERIASQWGDRNAAIKSLGSAGLTARALRRLVSDNVRAREWIERQIDGATAAPMEAIRREYDEHRDGFRLPPRLRACHLFLAAPEGSPAEVIETKRKLIDSLADRIAHGEALADLVAEFSEDEATKHSGGDLNYFAANRILPEFFGTVEHLRPGDITPPIRTRLGFHIVQLIDAKPAEQLPLEQVQGEIARTIASQQRRVALENLFAGLRPEVKIRRPL
jgi:parvulin-like peptidyl-prolyl isomerase